MIREGSHWASIESQDSRPHYVPCGGLAIVRWRSRVVDVVGGRLRPPSVVDMISRLSLRPCLLCCRSPNVVSCSLAIIFGATLQHPTCHKQLRQHNSCYSTGAHAGMSDQATDGSSHGGDPTRGQLDDGEAASDYSTNTNELFNYIGSQFSDPRRQYAQLDQVGRPVRGDVYEHRHYTERYERPQQPARSGVSRDSHPQQRQENQGLQASDDSRRLEE